MLIDHVGHGLASATGTVLGGLTALAGSIRPAAKPLHPTGRVVKACLYRSGLESPVGVPLLDETGINEVLVRESRAAGLPAPLPDVHGLAIRVTNSDGSHGDLLFSTTGWGRVTRFVLTPSRTTYSRPMTTLLPYRTEAGPLVLGARRDGGSSIELSCAIGDGEWQRWGDLVVTQQGGPDQDVSFDAVLNTVPGLEQYDAVRRIREPSYASARSTRR